MKIGGLAMCAAFGSLLGDGPLAQIERQQRQEHEYGRYHEDREHYPFKYEHCHNARCCAVRRYVEDHS